MTWSIQLRGTVLELPRPILRLRGGAGVPDRTKTTRRRDGSARAAGARNGSSKRAGGHDARDDMGFIREYEKKLGGRAKASRMLAGDASGFGDFMAGLDLDDILEPKAGKSALPDERAGKRFPSSRAKAADDFEPSEGRSEDISLPWEHADLNKQEPREKHGMKVPTATHVLGKQPGWAVTANDPTKGSEFLSGQGANARPEEPVDLEELNLPAAAVAGGIDTRGMFSQFAEEAEAESNQEETRKENGSPQNPEIAELLRIAKVAASQPMWGPRPQNIPAPRWQSDTGKEAATLEPTISDHGIGSSEHRKDFVLKAKQLAESARRNLALITGSGKVGGAGGGTQLASWQERSMETQDTGTNHAFRAGQTAREARRAERRRNYMKVVAQAREMGIVGKREDLSRGRAAQHVPSKLAAMLRIREPDESSEEEVEWQRQGRALRQMAAISHHREKLGAPTMMEIITQPGWDEKLGDGVFDLDTEGNLVFPNKPDYLPAAFAAHSEELKSLPKDEIVSRTVQEVEFACAASASSKPGDKDEDDGKLVVGSIAVDVDPENRVAILDEVQDGLQDAAIEEDKEKAQRWLKRLLELDPSTKELVVFPDIDHMEGLWRTESDADSVAILDLIQRLRQRWVERVKPKLEQEETEALVARPVRRPVKQQKKYAALKERLRNAGMPTGGKKRKLLARLKDLDEQEEKKRQKTALRRSIRTATDDTAIANHSDAVAGAGANENCGPASKEAATATTADLDDATDSSTPSEIDPRFNAIFKDPKFALDPTHEMFSIVKGRSHVYTKRAVEMKRMLEKHLEKRERPAMPQGSRSSAGKEDGGHGGLGSSAPGNEEPQKYLDPDAQAKYDLFGSSDSDSSEQEQRSRSSAETEISAYEQRSMQRADEAAFTQHEHAQLLAKARRFTASLSTRNAAGNLSEEDKSQIESETNDYLSSVALATKAPHPVDEKGISNAPDSDRQTQQKQNKKERKKARERERKKRRRAEASGVPTHPLDKLRFLRKNTAFSVHVPGVESESMGNDLSNAQSSACGHQPVQDARWVEAELENAMIKPRREELSEDGALMRRIATYGKFGGVINTAVGGGLRSSVTKSRHRRLGDNITSWGQEQVAVWLARLAENGKLSVEEMEQCAARLRHFEVGGRHLLDMDQNDLRDLGVTSARVTREVLQACTLLRRNMAVRKEPTKLEMRLEQQPTAISSNSNTDSVLQRGGSGVLAERMRSGTKMTVTSGETDLVTKSEVGSMLAAWGDALAPKTWAITPHKHPRDGRRLPEHELFENPQGGRPLPCAWLPTVRTPFGELRVYTEEDLKRENAHLRLDGPCPFECACCVL